MINRDYYSLEQAVVVLKCTIDDLIHLAANGKLTICALTNDRLEVEGYGFDFDDRTSRLPRFCIVPREYWVHKEMGEDIEINSVYLDDGKVFYFSSPIRDITSGQIHLLDHFVIKESELARLQPPKQDNPPTKSLTETERQSMLKIIIGMAMDAYQYDPESTKNKATGENNGSIKAALDRKGIKVDADTIRKYLNEAKDLLPPPA